MREREGEKHQYAVASHVPPTGDPAHKPGLCPDGEVNRRPPGLIRHQDPKKSSNLPRVRQGLGSGRERVLLAADNGCNLPQGPSL